MFSHTRPPAVPGQNRARLRSAVNRALVVLARAAGDQRGRVRRRPTVLHALPGQGGLRRPVRWRGCPAARLSRRHRPAAQPDRHRAVWPGPVQSLVQHGRRRRSGGVAGGGTVAHPGAEAERSRRSGLVSSLRLALSAAAESALVLRPGARKRPVPARARGAGHRRPGFRRRVRIAPFSRSSDRFRKAAC